MVRGKTRILQDDRFFEGKKWRFVSAHQLKQQAQKVAQTIRNRGLNARVLKGPSKRYPRAKYVVYKSNKK